MNAADRESAAGQKTAGESPTAQNAAGASTADTSTTEASTTGASAAGQSEQSKQSEPAKAVLSFSSFDGGGHEYRVKIENPEILSYTGRRDYGETGEEPETGSSYRMIFTFTGLKPGTTTVSVYGRSPISENDDSIYTAVVDENLNVTLKAVRSISTFFIYREADISYNTYKITLSMDGYRVSVNDGKEQSIDAESVEALMDVIDKYNVEEWNDFSESERHGPVEESFLLEVRLTDGTYIWARGDNVFPENYEPAINEIQQILDHAKIGSEAQ